jgi:cyanophycinase
MRYRPALLLLTALAMSGWPRAIAQQPRGRLFIVGGGDSPPGLVARFVELAGGPQRARLVVVPMASSEPEASGREMAEELAALGPRATVLIVTRAGALDTARAAAVDSATGIWFTGGDQSRLTAILGDTPLLAAMLRRYRAGAVIGGTSAGAAIMSDSMLTGNQWRPDSLGYYGDEYPAIARRTVEVVPGFGFLPGTIVDQHFLRRERHNRLLSAVLERPALIGLGIDEGTAVEVDPDGTWRVLGRSSVMIIDARHARVSRPEAATLGATGLTLHLLPAGGVYDPRLGRALLP